MKRSGNRLLAMLLCVAMMLTLLPLTAFARWDEEMPEIPTEVESEAVMKAELPADAPEDDGDSADLTAEVYPDAIQEITDWTQHDVTFKGADSYCRMPNTTGNTSGHLELGASSSNGKDGGSDNSGWPAVFTSTTLNNALTTNPEGKYTVEFKVKFQTVDMFGVFINYTDPSKGFFIGYNNNQWYNQRYGVDGQNWQNHEQTTLVENTVYKVELSWDATAHTASLKVQTEDGQTVMTNITNDSYADLIAVDGIETVNNFALTLGKWSNPAQAEIWDMHYSGQTPLTTYAVSGNVTGGEGAPLAGVTVTATPGDYTTTTDNLGEYSLELPNGTYTLTFSKDGYTTETKNVTVSNNPIPNQNVTMQVTHTVQIPMDGVDNGDWRQVANTVQPGAIQAVGVVDSKLVLTSGNTNGHKIRNTDVQTALFTSDKMNGELAASTDNTKTLSFTLVPETEYSSSDDRLPGYLAFGVVINSNEGNSGTFIGYSDVAGDRWLFQNYGGNGSYKAAAPLATPVAGQPLNFEFTWTNDTLTMKLNGEAVDLGDVGTISTMTKTNKIAFCAGGSHYENENGSLQTERRTKLTISNLHYSGQEKVTAHTVAGTVTDQANAPLGNVTVSAENGRYTDTADANGKYALILPEAATAYTVKAELDGYTTEEQRVTVNASSDDDALVATDFQLTRLPTISGKVVDEKGKGVLATVSSDKRPAGKVAVCDREGNFTIIGAVAGEHTLTIEAEGYEKTTVKVNVSDTNVTLPEDVVLKEREIPGYALETDEMTVWVAEAFPQAVKYTMKNLKDADGQPMVMLGQTAELDTIKINNVEIKPTVTSVKNSDKKVTYTMVVDETNNNGSGVTATITAELRVGLDDVNDKTSASAARTLGFYITKVVYPKNDRVEHPVDTIEIPNHSLVSVRSTQEEAKVKGAKLASNTIANGDIEYPAEGNINSAIGKYSEDFFAAFVSNDELSAGLASNSAYGSGSAGSGTYPVRVQFEAKDGNNTTSIGLGSTLWYYDHDITRDEAGGDQKLTLEQLPKEKRIIAPLEMPFAKVVIAGDENKNGTVDWQDGAIAYRETVMHIPAGGEGVADAVNLRISMNFGSMAANPFLIALDNVKRVAAHTDGLGQFVLLKGYAGEGHDSNHPQYDNIGVRMGGAEDMLTLMTEGEKLGATFGIHTNASEFYAEAIDDENQVRRNTDGSMHYGWNWLDQGIAINAVYDYASGRQLQRWNKLYNIVKGHPFTVYVDVWGNFTSGTENDFMTRALSQNIVGNGHDGWRIAHEWSYGNPYESTFQHWVTDYTYGDYSDKGKLNSNVMRFLLNQYKDSFTPDFATFGGAANAPLLGGPAMQGFEGWQGDGEYDLSIYNTFNQMVYTKFLQHYDIMEWSNAQQPTLMWWWVGAKSSRKTVSGDKQRQVENEDGTITLQDYDTQHNRWNNYGGTTYWTPENQIKLAGDGDKIVVTRGLDTTPDAHYDCEDGTDSEIAYRSRVVTLNGKKIVEGAPASAGEDTRFPADKATLKYLIPWYWDAKGVRVTNVDDEKLYHWNAKGGTSTWELQENWKDVANVMVYELSDQGRGTGVSVPVVDGTVTLTAKANTAYVVTRGATKAAAPKIAYGTGLHLQDPSFNIDTPKGPWTISGTGTAVHTTNSDGIGVMKMMGEVSVSQQMTDLKSGKTYVSYVAVDNRSDAKATMTITDNTGKVVATNYTQRSIARNYISSYYLHNNHGMEAGSSYFQNMYVYFTPQAGKTYTMTLSREDGDGNVYFDDLRTVEYRGTTSPVKYDATTGAAISLKQDFENVPQGYWPFVVGPVENVADNRSHLSELNAPFTQAGWDVKKMDDVIDGKWSVKVNGLVGRNNLVYQTIPQNFRFEPDQAYTVSFDYELGSEGAYEAVVGDGAYSSYASLTAHALEQTLNTTVLGNSGIAGNTTAKAKVGHIEFTVVGSKSGQTWVGIYSKGGSNDQGTSGSAADFGGYRDFVLDNLVIEPCSADKSALAVLIQDAAAIAAAPEIYKAKTGTDEEAMTALNTAIQNGQTVLENASATSKQVSDAKAALEAALDNLVKVNVVLSGTVTGVNNAPVAGAVITVEDHEYQPIGVTAVTDAEGKFEIRSEDEPALIPLGTTTEYTYTKDPNSAAVKWIATVREENVQMLYKLKVQATGYQVTTVTATEISKANPNGTATAALVAEAPGAYVNDFNDRDFSMMGYLASEGTTGVPTFDVVDFNGSPALEVTFNSNSRDTNNAVDKTEAAKITNGTVSFDITPKTNALRLGMTLRGTATNNRIFIGQEDQTNTWFWEWWTAAGGNNYDRVYKYNLMTMEPGITRRVRVELNDQRIQVYIDGIEVYDVTMTGAPTDAGYVGLNLQNNSGTKYILDNLRVVSADTQASGKYTIGGTVTTSGAPLAGAAVAVYDSTGETLITSTTTNAAGAYVTQAVDAGSYTIKVSALDYGTKQESVTVETANVTDEDFTLEVDKARLQNLYDTNKDITNDDQTYTAESFAAFAAARTKAEETLAKTTVTAAEIAADYEALKAAVEGLVGKPTDFSALRDLVNEKAKEEKTGYTAASWTEFQNKLAAAQTVLANGNATQNEVNAAKEALQTAFDGLETIDGLDALRDAYDAAKDVTNENYTDESWTAFEDARTTALAILNNADVQMPTADEINEAAKALTDAQAALAKKPSQPSGGGGTSTPSETTETETRDDGSKVTTVTKPDGSVTETVTQPDGTKSETVTAKNGDVTITVTDENGEELVKAEIPATIPEPETKFEDVDATPWAEEAIQKMAGLELVNGTGGNKYSPVAPMTRGSLATVLHRLSQGKTDYETTFKDVAQGKYYTEGVAWAAKAKVVTGYTEEIFAPDDVITREQLAVMLARYAKLIGMDTKADSKALDQFADGDSTGTWATDGVAWCVENGILKGKGQNNLDPTAKVTRAEVAVMLDRFIMLIQK